ncbi:MAG: hypothetical protein QF645_11295, partial [Planctomycetota bacterium]|nr:hypothetical protein [Planctomycetota bacterium]
LDEVEKERGRWKKTIPPTDPEPEFRRKWKDFLEKDQFLNAKNFVERNGQFLSKEKREGYLSKTEDACRAMVDARLKFFLSHLEKAHTLEYILKIRSIPFGDQFGLPNSSQLVISSPTLDWCRSVWETLVWLRKDRPRSPPIAQILDRVLPHALSSLPLVTEGENGWFTSMESLAYHVLSIWLQDMVKGAQNTHKARRDELRAACQRNQDQWMEFERVVFFKSNGRISKRRDVTSWARHFPIEVMGLENVQEDLFASAEADNPIEAVQAVETTIRKYRVQWVRLSIESRRFLLQHLMIAISIGKLLQGETVEDVIGELRELGKELKGLGGDFNVPLFGAKVEKVFVGLRKQS